MTIALCTKYLGVRRGLTPIAPSIILMDPLTARPLATMELEKHALLGGVYAFLDEHDRVVIAESNTLLRMSHHNTNGRWTFHVDRRTPLTRLPKDVSIAGVVPDGTGTVWFATSDALIGSITPDGAMRTLKLGKGERIANGLTPPPDLTACPSSLPTSSTRSPALTLA